MQNPENPNLFRIRALRDIPRFKVKAGDLGGYVEKENNLSQARDCWVGDDAVVCGVARVYGNAHIYNDARVFGKADIFNHARIYGSAWISDNAQIYRSAQIFGHARIYGNTKIFGAARVFDNAQIYGDAEVHCDAWVFGNAQVAHAVWLGGSIKLNGHMILTGSGGRCNITSLEQIYYVDGVTAFYTIDNNLIVAGTTDSTSIEHHKTLAMLKLL